MILRKRWLIMHLQEETKWSAIESAFPFRWRRKDSETMALMKRLSTFKHARLFPCRFAHQRPAGSHTKPINIFHQKIMWNSNALHLQVNAYWCLYNGPFNQSATPRGSLDWLQNIILTWRENKLPSTSRLQFKIPAGTKKRMKMKKIIERTMKIKEELDQERKSICKNTAVLAVGQNTLFK